MEAILLALVEVKVKTEVEEASLAIIITAVTVLIIIIGEEVKEMPLKEITIINKVIETRSTRVRIGKKDSGEIKMDKVGVIITETMTIRANADEAGEAIIITGDSKINTEVEAVAGTSN